MRVLQVDAFTSKPFRGNPAAVVLPDAPLDDDTMQAIAREMNLSETAFVVAGGEPDGGAAPDADAWRLRWFTPTTEIDLCGHATLATAHALWEEGRLDPASPARFDTRSGRLTCQREPDGAIAMDLPADPPSQATLPEVVRSQLPPVSWTGRSRAWYVARLDRADLLRSWQPDLGAIASLNSIGLVITAAGDRPGLDIVSRAFLPQLGIPEDPVTGAAHAAVGPLWAAWLELDEVRCEQASARGGELRVRVHPERVDVIGPAVTVLAGELHLDAG